MDLWIRSQDKTSLINTNSIFIDDTDMVDKGYVTIYSKHCEVELGTYKTKERALEVLNEIDDCITINSAYELYAKLGKIPYEFNDQNVYRPVYRMPKE